METFKLFLFVSAFLVGVTLTLLGMNAARSFRQAIAALLCTPVITLFSGSLLYDEPDLWVALFVGIVFYIICYVTDKERD
jgi:hypothetical protein